MDFKKKSLGLLFFLIILAISPVQAQVYRVSLLTCDPGEDLYSAFGHSAIRVTDTRSGRDMVFNYGTFDFDTPNFYLKFTQGKLDYQLSVTTYARFIQEYDRNKRDVREQVLNTSQEQNRRLVEFLEINYLPERRGYRYDFFFDNCATRIRDALELALNDKLIWNDPNPKPEPKTFRNLVDEYVYPLPWADFGIDLALGSVIDAEASSYEKQFLPDYLEAAFARAEIQGDGPTRALVKESTTILSYPDTGDKGMEAFNPYLILWAVAIIFTIVTFWGFKKKRLFIGFDIALFGVLGLLGVVVFLLWFFTDHTATKWNWNLLWAFPAHLLLVKGLLAKKVAPWVKKYLLFALIMADAVVVFWILGWQSFHPSLVPLLLVLILRTNYLYYNVERLKAWRQ